MKVSIITASYNYAQYIGQTIESVLAQTYPNWELIIVDDGSTDNSVNVIQDYCKLDSRVKLFTHLDGKNHGLATTIQFGLEKATGDWIAFLESDDMFEPTAIEEKVHVIEKYPNIGVVFTNFKAIGSTNLYPFEFWEMRRLTWLKRAKPGSFNGLNVAFCIIPTLSVAMVRKELLLRCRFDTPVPACLDWYLWTQLENELFFYIDKSLTCWRIHPKSFTHKGNKKWRLFRSSVPRLLNNKRQISMIEKFYDYILYNCKIKFCLAYACGSFGLFWIKKRLFFYRNLNNFSKDINEKFENN